MSLIKFESLKVFSVQHYAKAVRNLEGDEYLREAYRKGADFSKVSRSVEDALSLSSVMVVASSKSQKQFEFFLGKGGLFRNGFRDDCGLTEAMYLVRSFGIEGLRIMREHDVDFTLDECDIAGNTLLNYIFEFLDEEDFAECAEMLSVTVDDIASECLEPFPQWYSFEDVDAVHELDLAM